MLNGSFGEKDDLVSDTLDLGKEMFLFPTEGAYFTSSRIGGKRGIIKELAVTLQGPEDNTLLFESRFESGNLQKAVRVGIYEYELTLRTDLYTDKHTQWFYFRVQNTRKEVTYRFTIVNLLKPKSLYAVGMKPLMYSELDATTYNIGWRRAGHEIKYYKNNMEEGQQSLYCLTWTLQFPHDQDTCFFAHFYPYTYTDLQCYLLSIANNPIQSQFCKLRALCRSLAGNTVYLLTITNPSRTPQEAAAKKAVVLSARVHPGESNGSWIMRGFLDFILSNSPDAQLLRDIFVFKVIPMLNPDGVIVGNYRCSLAGRDLNRHYKTVLKDSFPCIWYTKNMIKRLLEEREVLLYCDFHGHSRKNNIFLYGCNSNSRKHWLHERVFPLMLSKNAPDKFCFDSCNFKVQKCKEGTGRVVMWRMGIINSYTMESTFGGSTLGRKRDTHFTIEDLKSLGYHVCDTILDFCDPDQTKYTQCLQELKELLQQEIHKKFNNFGQDMDLEGNWSDIPLSDIESSTSGSDSSLSDGLPAHLLNIADELPALPRRRARPAPAPAGPLRPKVSHLDRQKIKAISPDYYAQHIASIDGKRGLFTGLTPRLCSGVLGTVVHGKVLQHYQECDKPEELVSGNVQKENSSSFDRVIKETTREMIARSAATLITHPFHVITLRSMVQFIGRESKYWGLIPRLLGDIISLWLCNSLAYLVNTYALDSGFFASMLTYPFVLVSNLMAVNNCGEISTHPSLHSPNTLKELEAKSATSNTFSGNDLFSNNWAQRDSSWCADACSFVLLQPY
ncbi:Cytosolic carboxypeptidase 2 [Cricetulus griseus]|uniref:Cytosolic carboxypeptidase 2 n=1 Tax=Cricetulus griseus TaxID=10029 RepID=G3GYL6_CRIGR|nr:Cytosolic carboxypeptidase 2 [Cricetulus griseus]